MYCVAKAKKKKNEIGLDAICPSGGLSYSTFSYLDWSFTLGIY